MYYSSTIKFSVSKELLKKLQQKSKAKTRTPKTCGGQHKGLWGGGEQQYKDTSSSSSLGRADDRQGCRTDIDRSSPLIARPDSCTHFATKTTKCTQMIRSWAA